MILSSASIFIRLSENEIGPFATIFNRLWIAIVTLVAWKAFTKTRSKIIEDASIQAEIYTKKDIALSVIFGLITLPSLLLWAWSLTATSVTNSNLLHNTTPFFVVLIGWLFFAKKIDSYFLIGLVLGLGGTISISIEDFQISPGNLRGDIAALLSALSYAGSYIVLEKLREKFSTTTVLLWLCSIELLVVLPLTLLTENQLFPFSLNGWLVAIALGVLCQVIGQGIMAYSLKQFSSGFVSLFLLLEPIFTSFLAWIIFAEKLTIMNGVAFFVVLTGIYLAQLSQSVNKQISSQPEIS
ncbi:MAG: DMT family transporter [Okeania sp. SIO3I5]|uniref:DMT family transporter n=1 Tax=Okeania sp. SIO3I5 TaxID=2607805 RepID=UPI0013BB13FE|nr:DMT family transporter [Okeania sp. SIO3I5]NEQ38894.1 DMT family transporter [Okeania sp. SIO3I5]